MTATKSASTRPVQPAPLPLAPPIWPDGELLAGFGNEELEQLRHAFSEPIEYVSHDLFSKSNVEHLLFGRKALLPGVCTSFQDGGLKDPIHDFQDGTSTLTTAQEILLFQRYNYARKRLSDLVERHRGVPITVKTLREVLAWSKRAGDARNLIAQVNVPLVLAMGKRTRLSGLDFNELVSEGNFALLRSVDKFDCSRGFKFSTYACRAILKSFSRVAMKASRYRMRFPTEFDPTLEKSDFVDKKRDTVEEACVEEVRDILAQNRADLNDIEKTVIRERFALDGTGGSTKPKTLEQVGQMIGVTKERVRQIQNKALKKIRMILEDNYLAA